MDTTAVKMINTQDFTLDDLHPHPKNPNRGDIDAIADSLNRLGQYRSVVIDQSNTILAGHHVWRAARKLGWSTISATIVDCDAQAALAIVLGDNRLADLGLGPDLQLLLEALTQLEDLTGTGFDAEYIQMLEEAVLGPPDEEHEPGDDDGDELDEDQGFYRRVTLLLDRRVAARWSAIRKLYSDDSAAFATLLGKDPVDEF